jgi:hypothetical protein
MVELWNIVLALMPRRRCRCCRCRRVGIEDLAEAVRSLVSGTGEAGINHGRDRREAQDRERQDQDGEHRHLHFLGLDLLAEILGRAADHQPGDEHRDDGEQQHAVEARADAADDDLAELDVEQRHQPAERREAVVHGLTAPHEASVVTVANSAELAMPKRTSLPSMLPPARPSCGEGRVAGRLGPVGDVDAARNRTP